MRFCIFFITLKSQQISLCEIPDVLRGDTSPQEQCHLLLLDFPVCMCNCFPIINFFFTVDSCTCTGWWIGGLEVTHLPRKRKVQVSNVLWFDPRLGLKLSPIHKTLSGGLGGSLSDETINWAPVCNTYLIHVKEPTATRGMSLEKICRKQHTIIGSQIHDYADRKKWVALLLWRRALSEENSPIFTQRNLLWLKVAYNTMRVTSVYQLIW